MESSQDTLSSQKFILTSYLGRLLKINKANTADEDDEEEQELVAGALAIDEI